MDDLIRMKELAGVLNLSEELNTLNEIVDKESLVDLADVERRLVHCRKALSIANTLPDPADRKKWKGAALANLNRVRAALNRIVAGLENEAQGL